MSFSLSQKVLFKHCDPAGIVFYPRYFEMINDAVEVFFDDVVGASFETMHSTHGVPTVQIASKFVTASRHGDVLDISVIPTRLGNASLDLAVTATCVGQVRFISTLTLVYVRKDMSTERWPNEMRIILNSQLQSNLKDVANG